MTFNEVLSQTIAMLHQHGRVSYRQALTLAEELGMRPRLAYCHRDLCPRYATTGQQEQPRRERATAMALSSAMVMTFWLPQTEVALA